MIKNIVFDFGGVIFDLDYEGALVTFKKIGLADAEERLDRYHQRGIFEDLESGRSDRNTFRRELSKLLTPPRELTEEEVLGAWLGYIGGLIDQEKLDYIDNLRRRGFHTFLLSNTNPYVQQWAESKAFSPCGRPLSSYLEKCYCSFEVGMMKPDPAIFRHMLEDACLKPEETLFLDDSPANIATAERLGINTLLVEKNGDWRQAVEERLKM
ncbi:MAG: HAD family phosphatase [Bacteroidales bacterium]|nr:HAD family phosphatase [Bacteroidales bacterium]